nr:hypothetical protein CFP56_21162 [Quercus suber]
MPHHGGSARLTQILHAHTPLCLLRGTTSIDAAGTYKCARSAVSNSAYPMQPIEIVEFTRACYQAESFNPFPALGAKSRTQLDFLAEGVKMLGSFTTERASRTVSVHALGHLADLQHARTGE